MSQDGALKLLAGECRYRAACLQLPHLDEIGPPLLYVPAILYPNVARVLGQPLSCVVRQARVHTNLSEAWRLATGPPLWKTSPGKCFALSQP